MEQSEAIDIEGRVDVVALDLPADMETEQRAHAQRCRIGDVLVMLEVNHKAVEQVLDDRIAQEMPEGVTAETTLDIAKDDPVFYVKIAPIAQDGGTIDRRGLAGVLPGAVQDVVSSYIGERATHVGMWEPRIVAQLATQSTSGKGERENGGHRSVNRLIGWLVGLGIVSGLVWLFLRSQ